MSGISEISGELSRHYPKPARIASMEYVEQLERRIAYLETRIDELMKMQPPAPIYLQVSDELRGALVEHLKQMGVKGK